LLIRLSKLSTEGEGGVFLLLVHLGVVFFSPPLATFFEKTQARQNIRKKQPAKRESGTGTAHCTNPYPYYKPNKKMPNALRELDYSVVGLK
jgi:hypothetical protein